MMDMMKMKTVTPKENAMAEKGMPMKKCPMCGMTTKSCVCDGMMEASKKK